MKPEHLVVGISGASGIAYGVRFVEVALRLGHHVHLLVSNSAWRVMQEECGLAGVGASSPLSAWLPGAPEEAHERVHRYHIGDIAARPASGTFKARAMVVVPCSMRTVAGLATGNTDNLLLRCGDVFLKERRTLVLVPRETPLSLIHLRNMATLSEAGAHIVPAMPGFYHSPKTIDDLLDFMAMKLFDLLGIEHGIPHAWQGPRRERDNQPA
ncbi:MAG: flavin prenyltransferase UbiX [Candidatus Sumerlaeia bacterium]|nr:flavin prenyltransferase UbiX [Candidatus Sumerlaeia bacterium]